MTNSDIERCVRDFKLYFYSIDLYYVRKCHLIFSGFVGDSIQAVQIEPEKRNLECNSRTLLSGLDLLDEVSAHMNKHGPPTSIFHTATYLFEPINRIDDRYTNCGFTFCSRVYYSQSRTNIRNEYNLHFHKSLGQLRTAIATVLSQAAAFVDPTIHTVDTWLLPQLNKYESKP